MRHETFAIGCRSHAFFSESSAYNKPVNYLKGVQIEVVYYQGSQECP